MIPATPFTGLCDAIESRRSELVDIRRDLHQHPELSHQEKRTTAVLADRLGQAAIPVRRLPGTGLIADLGPADARFRVALRADIDALPVRERTGLDFASISPDVCHACGHDVHTTALLGAALALGDLRDYLDATGTAVRFFFQAAEESIPGGADDIIAEGGMLGVDAAYALHCDPGLDVGQVGLREGALTAACDRLTVNLKGHGGHTSRPHLTEDLTFALAKVVTDLPTVLARRVDPRASALIVWGQVHAGRAGNVIPSTGFAEGTLRVLDSDVWRGLAPLLERIVDEVTAPFGVQAELTHVQGVPPVVNTAAAIGDLRSAVATVGLKAVPTAQSMGGEDFAWYLHHASGAMARLGTRTAGGRTYDLHQGDYIVDERAIEAGAKLLGAVGLTALERFLADADVPTS
ncbi:amidohydrolase [Nostocoides jenkinsii]|jgi:amidohydrolase|uniref:Peptidase M20D, amidohydrolase n=1 Tax=Nostocoides jenkinsii Ben 74 TaxID=1193518 RepID=A0A077MBV4_9MICO|nr:amidohydrolase [Tetrasphaera jenkinsii]CCI52163.1 Peptidase M20D, amidohydrolase [Tetrasphaera jenkinsii Ben 74]